MFERVVNAINKTVYLGVLILLSLAVCVPSLQATQAPASCNIGHQTVLHGEGVTAYLTPFMPFRQDCVSERRYCDNGTLSGSYEYLECYNNPPSACSFGGQMVIHEDSVTAYQSEFVPYGETCVSESRVCDNGTLSGTYPYSKCTVPPPADCRFNGKTVGHGGHVLAYQSDSVPYGQTCESEDRFCDNGVLSGNYGFLECTVGDGPGDDGEDGPGDDGGNGPGDAGGNGPGDAGENGPGDAGGNGPGDAGENGPGDAGENGPGDDGENGPGDDGENGPGDDGENGPGDDGGNGPGDDRENGPGDDRENGPGDAGGNGPGDAVEDGPRDAVEDGPGDAAGNPPPLPEFDILALPASFALAGLWFARSKKRRSAPSNRRQKP